MTACGANPQREDSFVAAAIWGSPTRSNEAVATQAEPEPTFNPMASPALARSKPLFGQEMKVVKFNWPWTSKRKVPNARRGFDVNFPPFEQYVFTAHARQNAIDLVPGWNVDIARIANAAAAPAGAYDDSRIRWAIEQFGDLADQRVLEIGPMEANHTYLLERAGAKVHSVEANKLGFLKCLIAKEILGLRATFSLAEANDWLRQSTEKYDFIVACGILYHMRDPVAFLELLAGRSSSIFLWTHVVSDDECASATSNRHPYFSVEQRHGLNIRLFARSYLLSPQAPEFCGGVYDQPRWMMKEDLLALLAALGFDDVRVSHEEAHHANGPAMAIYAQKARE